VFQVPGLSCFTGEIMSKNAKETSRGVGSLAGRTLQDPNASQIQRSLAGAALAQRGTGKQTGAAMEGMAARALASTRSAQDTQTLAASVVSQSNRKR
jgi:hypothetical protein